MGHCFQTTKWLTFSLGPCLILWLSCLDVVLAQYFCQQFFVAIKDRIIFNFTVNDATPVGNIIHNFPSPPDLPERTVLLSSPDTSFVGFDHSTFSLVVRSSLRPRNGDVLEINGTCIDFLPDINVNIPVEVAFLITVQDVNDPPRFVNLPGVLNIYENASVGSVVYTVKTDSSFDLTPDFQETFLSIEAVTALETSRPSPGRTFYIDDDGNIHLLQTLDYEMGPRFYKLKILARDNGDPPMKNTSLLTIHVKDVDDMPPKFSNSTYYAEVIGEKPLQGKEECFDATPVVEAEDQDRFAKSDVNYEILNGEPGAKFYWSQFFRIEAKSGLICQKQMVQRLLRDELTGRDVFYNFTFTIKAFQTDHPEKSDTAMLFIHVVDANSHSPSFERGLYRSTLKEFPVTTEGTLVTRVLAHDKDHGLNSLFKYEFVNNPEDAFALDTSGRITVKNPAVIDRELHQFLEFKVRAIETNSVDKQSDITRVLVQIIDVNDHAPEFANDTYRYTIKDSLSTGLPIHPMDRRPKAYDKDSGNNGKIEYKITGVWRLGGQTLFADLGRFAADTDTGVIRLAGTLRDLRRKRDYPIFHLALTGFDRAEEKDRLSTSINVYVRIEQANDHPPKFLISGDEGNDINGQSIHFNISEDAHVGTVIAKLQAVDEDGDNDVFLKYDIVSGSIGDLFYITDKGWVTLKKPLDREDTSDFDLEIQVSDGIHSVRTNISIRVDDVNDNVPEFTSEEYEFYMMEESPPGTVVGRVEALDQDLGLAGVVQYLVKFGKGADSFSVREDGTLVVWKSSPLLDREQNEKIQLKVIATDLGPEPLKSSVDVTIYLTDTNDHRPSFEAPFYTGIVEEDDWLPAPQIVAIDQSIRAVDEDAEEVNRALRYSLTGSGSDKFVIDPKTAIITVAKPGSIDCELKCEYDLKLTVTDRGGEGTSSTVDLTIKVKDANDNSPNFDNAYNYYINGTASVGTKVGHVEAFDKDVTEPNNRLIYILKKGGFGKFAVDFETGDIMVSDTISREPFNEQYELLVQALDGGSPRRHNDTRVIINVPVNHAPTILQHSTQFSLDEEVDNGTLVGQILVHDKDNIHEAIQQHIFYTLDLTVPFQIDHLSGKILTNGIIDREEDTHFKFLVFAEDDGQPPKKANATVTVDIKDTNDHAPLMYLAHYSGFVVEDDTEPRPLQQVSLATNVTVTDHDATPENRNPVLSLQGEHAEWFSIDSNKGTITVSSTGSGKIDREKHELFALKIRATDQGGSGLFSESNLIIRVSDVNDNGPKFHVLPHELFVHEDVQIGQEIGTLLAKDLDATAPNNQILYTLESDSYGKFKLDLRTGRISVLRGLFFLPREPTYILRVSAVDMGSPPQRSEVTVTIKVNKQNFNDFKPEILGENIFDVNEEVPIGTLVGTLRAEDEDLGPGEMISLTIQSDRTVPFSIDSQTGEVRTSGRLDYDSGVRAYTFSVLARDEGDPPKEAQTYVGVILTDINDNPPRFARAVYRHRVNDQFPVGTIVATPFAFDNVDSDTGEYRYRMEGEGAGVYFSMDASNGIVITTEQLPQTVQTMMEYVIYATDTEKPDLVAVARLIIDIDHEEEMPEC